MSYAYNVKRGKRAARVFMANREFLEVATA